MRKESILKLLAGYLLLNLLFISCTHHNMPVNSANTSTKGTIAVTSPPCIIYRTRSDYFLNVPVTLSADRSKIVSYPDIRDIWFNGKLSVPTRLANGFLLDNRGIGLQVAFLSYTYEEYSKLSSTPTATDLMSMLLDKDPLTEMYQCGQRSQYTDIEQALNALITSGKLNTCKKLK
jgi:hypothetical protein